MPLGFVLTSEITYNDNISAIQYENLNIKASTSSLTGADTNHVIMEPVELMTSRNLFGFKY
jgi:hypothetical protein